MELVMVSKWYKKKRFGGKVGGREREREREATESQRESELVKF
jgi:hypothetical protein